MTSDSGGSYYWCLWHNRVETDRNVCAAPRTMGPYQTSAEAEQAVARVKQREKLLEAEDERWSSRQP